MTQETAFNGSDSQARTSKELELQDANFVIHTF